MVAQPFKADPAGRTGCEAKRGLQTSRRRTDSAWLWSPSLSASSITAAPVASRAYRLNWIREV